MNDNPLFEPITDFSKAEDFTAFDLNLSGNISDVESADNLLNISYTLNNSGVFSVSINNDTDVATFTAIANQFGSVEVNFTVVDPDGGSNTTSLTLTVTGVND
ncbi:cadherin-like domain-containing protein, partial [Candidatus Parcubacteria bacterium]|nr:cadherin-like domain-containing protein [Candidatus Parcubacteria bacterium]